MDDKPTYEELAQRNRELERVESDRQRMEKALEESEARFRLLYERAPLPYQSLDESGCFIEVNQSWLDIMGYSRGAVLGKSFGDFLHPDWRDHFKENFPRFKAVGEILGVEFEMIKKDGSLILVSFHGKIGKNKYGDFQQTHCIFQDITDRRRAEDELRHLRNYLSNIIDSMPSVLVGVDAEARITLWNKTAEKTTGVVGAHAQGHPLSHIFPWLALEMEKITESIRTREIKHHRKRACVSERGTCYEDVTIYPLTGEGVEGAVIRIDDVTEQVRLEEMMVQSEKMLSVGGLAAGMAHEINNPLAGMMQAANVMAGRLTNENMPANLKAAREAGVTMPAIRNFMEARGIPRMLEIIRDAGSRAAEIVSNMLSFVRKSEAQDALHDLSGLIDKTLDLAATDYDLKKRYDFKAIEIQREYEAGLPPVSCEGPKIQQVLLNIFRNGAESMQAAGTGKPMFIVRTKFEKERKMVCMEIEDNGPGMDESIRKRVFEPFYTTKAVGEGTGLGLSVSYFIITENHGGKMAVESQPGKGAKFVIRLPLEG
jgi:PAS domain S-box-containing protein